MLENEPVDAFYRTVKRAGKLLKLTDDLIIDQFFRGLSADNIFEAERFSNLNPDDLRRIIQDHQDPDWDDGYVEPDVGDDPDAPKAKDRRDDLDLAQAMRNLDLNDDAMDIDTVSFGEKVELREKDGDIYMSSPNKTAVSSPSVPLRGKATPVKIPVKVTGSKSIPAKAVTKNDLLNLLRSADFRKLLCEILQEEMMSARKVTEISEVQDLAEEE
ncbi:hypothetical protein RIR_jg1253.t2 [Rhizophagus irregularis DAOM 181602=DAOM 197198]|nr:hypothetical protein RIR_jg1253.t2 [Rhizophagus irregularis DAOM 181602=DAOM 197198]